VTVIGIDDTDSRDLGMCTTYAAARLAETLSAAGATVERTLLVRLHPAIEHKIGDRVTVCGEVGDGTLNLEKFAVRELVETKRDAPTCSNCGRLLV